MADFDRLLQKQPVVRFSGGHGAAKMQMIEQANRFDGIGCCDLTILDHDQMIAVSMFATDGMVAGTRKNFRRGKAKIRHNKFVMNVDALTPAPFALEGFWCRTWPAKRS